MPKLKDAVATKMMTAGYLILLLVGTMSILLPNSIDQIVSVSHTLGSTKAPLIILALAILIPIFLPLEKRLAITSNGFLPFLLIGIYAVAIQKRGSLANSADLIIAISLFGILLLFTVIGAFFEKLSPWSVLKTRSPILFGLVYLFIGTVASLLLIQTNAAFLTELKQNVYELGYINSFTAQSQLIFSIFNYKVLFAFAAFVFAVNFVIPLISAIWVNKYSRLVFLTAVFVNLIFMQKITNGSAIKFDFGPFQSIYYILFFATIIILFLYLLRTFFEILLEKLGIKLPRFRVSENSVNAEYHMPIENKMIKAMQGNGEFNKFAHMNPIYNHLFNHKFDYPKFNKNFDYPNSDK